MNQFDHGYAEAITRILNYINLRRAAYKSNEQLDKYVAMDRLYKDLVMLFKCEVELPKEQE